MRTLGGALRLLGIGVAITLAPEGRAVMIDWVDVGDPGNPPDIYGYGAVDYPYRIAKYEVTNAEYAEFLNAVAATDANDLYSTEMGSGWGGIARVGSPSSYVYRAIDGREALPVLYVTVWDGMRYANWLHNGQPTGAQDDSTTENGAYRITAAGVLRNTVTRNAGAMVFLPSEDEWYKAAYYDASLERYFDYPAGTDVEMICAAPGPTPNTANCGAVVGDVTPVGSYPGSPAPNGGFDLGGNVWEWNDTRILDSYRAVGGGSWGGSSFYLASTIRLSSPAGYDYNSVGLRVASIPEPASGWLLAAGLLGLAGGSRRRS